MDIKYTFSDFPLDVIFRSMAPFIANLEQAFHITAVCGQIAGGRAMGLSNSKSDNDFDIFYEQAEGFTPPGLKYIQEVTICGKPVVVEFNFINFHKLVNAAKTAFSQEHQGYPTTFYRSASEVESFLPENILPRWERSEYLFTKFHTFIMGDNYWYAASSRFDIRPHWKMEKTIDALDYYFVRAYGNYQNYLTASAPLHVRRYLNCIWQTLSLEWILTRGTKPPVHIKHLIEELITSSSLKDSIYHFYDLNCNSDIDKKDLFCPSDDTINQYIFRSLCRYKEELHNYNRSETIYDLMQRTPPAKRSIGYLIPVNTAS